jgi:hypothetical protein
MNDAEMVTDSGVKNDVLFMVYAVDGALAASAANRSSTGKRIT